VYINARSDVPSKLESQKLMLLINVSNSNVRTVVGMMTPSEVTPRDATVNFEIAFRLKLPSIVLWP
jgi:hypothetical protein